jgi:hypothetical protein
MSLFLLSTALITTLLIPADAFRAAGPNDEPAGPANGRALAYLVVTCKNKRYMLKFLDESSGGQD